MNLRFVALLLGFSISISGSSVLIIFPMAIFPISECYTESKVWVKSGICETKKQSLTTISYMGVYGFAVLGYMTYNTIIRKMNDKHSKQTVNPS